MKKFWLLLREWFIISCIYATIVGIFMFIGQWIYSQIFSEISFMKFVEKCKLLFPALFTGYTATVVAYVTYRSVTKRLDEKKELVEFHEKYIEIKNEISKWLVDTSQQNNDTKKKVENINQLSYLFSKTINLLFEEYLSSKENDQVEEKLKDEDGWLVSTSDELTILLEFIERENLFPGLAIKSLIDLNKKTLEPLFETRLNFPNQLKREVFNRMAGEVFKLQRQYQEIFSSYSSSIAISKNEPSGAEALTERHEKMISIMEKILIDQGQIRDKIKAM